MFYRRGYISAIHCLSRLKHASLSECAPVVTFLEHERDSFPQSLCAEFLARTIRYSASLVEIDLSSVFAQQQCARRDVEGTFLQMIQNAASAGRRITTLLGISAAEKTLDAASINAKLLLVASGILDGGQLLYPGSLPLKTAIAIQQLADAASSPASRIFTLLGIRRDAEVSK